VGKLVVHLGSAAGLKAADINGLSDPYIYLRSGERTAQSSVVAKTLDPTFGEDLELCGSFGELSAAGLIVEVYDKNAMRFDVLLGSATVSLDGLKKKAQVSFTEMALAEQGTISFSVSWNSIEGGAAEEVGTPDEEAGETVEKKDDKKAGKKAPSKSPSRMNMFAPKLAPPTPTAILARPTFHPVAAEESQNLPPPPASLTVAPGAGIMDSIKGMFSPPPSDNGSGLDRSTRPDLQA